MRRPTFIWMAPTLTALGTRFGFDAHYFAKNSAVVSMSHGISMVKGIVTGYLVTRLFPPEMYGEFRFVLSVVGFISFIGIAGLPSALAAAIARKEPVALASIARWYGMISSIGAFLLLGSIPFLHYWDRKELWPLFLIAALVFTPGAVANNLFGGAVRGTGAFTTAFKATLIANILVTASVLLMLIFRPSSVLLLAFTTAIPAAIYLYYLIPFERQFRSNASQHEIKKTALHLSIATIPTSLSWYIDSLLISALFGLNQLALFSVALLIPEQVKIWTKELFPILFSKQASGKDTRDRRHKMHLAVLLGTASFAGGILIYALLAPLVIPLIFPLYPTAELVPLTIAAAVILLPAPSTIYPQYLEARGMVRGVHLSNWIASAFLVTSLVILIPYWGIMGAIISRGIFRTVYSLTAFILVMRTPTED